MDRSSIGNWKFHVKQNGSVYSVQYTINEVSELPRNEGFKRGARRPVVKIVYYNRPLPVVGIILYNRPALLLFDGKDEVQFPLDNEGVRNNHE
jgi:hypothetical protein